jgi:hypothetical protein
MNIEVKSTVYCFKDAFSRIQIGKSLEGIVPINHPNSNMNGILVITSQVIDANSNGSEFWTKNTHYVVVTRVDGEEYCNGE